MPDIRGVYFDREDINDPDNYHFVIGNPSEHDPSFEPAGKAVLAAYKVFPEPWDSVDDWVGEHQPGVVIETVGGEADTITEAVRCVRPGGRIVVVGVFGTPRPTDFRDVVLKELEIIGSFIYGTVGSGSEFGAAVSRMGSIADELTLLQTHHYGLTEVAQAFAIADDKASLAVKVTIGGTDHNPE